MFHTILPLMSATTHDTQALADHQIFIKQELLPNISKMRRYLGAVNYNTEFYRRKRGTRDSLSWEFEDRDTKDVFEAMIIGEVADPALRTLLKGKGNYKPPKSIPVRRLSLLAYSPPLKNCSQNLPLTDTSNVKNVIVLQNLTGSTVNSQKAFLNQTVPLNNIIEHVIKEDKLSRTVSS